MGGEICSVTFRPEQPRFRIALYDLTIKPIVIDVKLDTSPKIAVDYAADECAKVLASYSHYLTVQAYYEQQFSHLDSKQLSYLLIRHDVATARGRAPSDEEVEEIYEREKEKSDSLNQITAYFSPEERMQLFEMVLAGKDELTSAQGIQASLLHGKYG